jgi:hypothetical protein
MSSDFDAEDDEFYTRMRIWMLMKRGEADDDDDDEDDDDDDY